MRRLRQLLIILSSMLIWGCGSSYQPDNVQNSDEANRAAVEKEMQEIETAKKAAKEKVQKEKEEQEKVEQEQREKEERERAEREAKEKEEQEKAEQEAREKAEQEKVEQEDREKQEPEELAEADVREKTESKPESKHVGNEYSFDKYYISGRENTEYTYVLNTSTMKIHHPDCSSVPTIKPENFAETNKSIQELELEGYSTCGKEKWP